MDPLALITVGGAAGAFFWVLQWIVNGKLHAHSEVEGLRADKAELFAANKVLSDANVAVVTQLKEFAETVVPILNEVLDLLREEDTS